MKRTAFVLIFFLLLFVDSASTQITTQTFTGTVTSIVTSLGAPLGPGFLGTPVGAAVSGQFTIDTNDFGAPIPLGSPGFNCAGTTAYPGDYSGSSSISLLSPEGSIDASGISNITFGPCARGLQFGNGSGMPSISLTFQCYTPNSGALSPAVGYGDTSLDIFPIPIPTPLYPGPGYACDAVVGVGSGVTINGLNESYTLWINLGTVSGAVSPTPTQAAAPVFSPAAGTYAAAQTVTLLDSTAGASIYYTTDGTTPTTSSAAYTAPITVGSTETVQAIAAANGYGNSTVASATYTVVEPIAATPAFSPAGGSFTAPQSVTISEGTPGVSIYYTTNGTPPSTSSMLYAGPITVNTTELLQAIAAAPGDVNSATASAQYTITAPPLPAAAQILDPVPDLLDGPQITSDTGTLAAGGRTVVGVAADGVAQVVLRIPVQAEGDQVSATLVGSNISLSEDGGVFNPVYSASTPSISAHSTADATVNAYLAYLAPADFVRPSSPGDNVLSSRVESVQLTYTSANGTVYYTTTVPVQIVRPPLILIHGYASDARETWANFTALTSDPRFKTFQVNYGKKLDVKSTLPGLGFNCETEGKCLTNIRQSDLGFTVNTFGNDAQGHPLHLPNQGVARQIMNFITSFDDGQNPLNDPENNQTSMPVAGVRADIIAHSMGGLIARNWTLNKSAYLSDETFAQGYINKFITLGTPHLGTPFATVILTPAASCTRNYAVENFGVKIKLAPQRVSITSAVLETGISVPGAVGELAGDGIGKHVNEALQDLANSTPLFTATIAGSLDAFASPYSNIIFQRCQIYTDPVPVPHAVIDPMASRFTNDLFNTLFDPQITLGNPFGSEPRSNDGAVPLTSALRDPETNLRKPKIAEAQCDEDSQCFNGYAHGANTARLSGADHFLVDDSIKMFNQLMTLLNTSIRDSSVWRLQ